MKSTSGIIFSFAVLLMAGCSLADKASPQLSTHQASEEPTEPSQEDSDYPYVVEAGDALFIIAQKVTGDGENWREIAEYNDIRDPRRLKVDDILLIPDHLLLANRQSNDPATQSEGVKIGTVNQDAISERNEIHEFPGTEKSADAKPDPVLETDSNTGWVMVEGSYYPKAIYLVPDYAGELLTRVLPGTTLRHLDTQRDWFKVDTDKGTGYVHASDARIMNRGEIEDIAAQDF